MDLIKEINFNSLKTLPYGIVRTKLTNIEAEGAPV
jgi:hypothetical protein